MESECLGGVVMIDVYMYIYWVRLGFWFKSGVYSWFFTGIMTTLFILGRGRVEEGKRSAGENRIGRELGRFYDIGEVRCNHIRVLLKG